MELSLIATKSDTQMRERSGHYLAWLMAFLLLFSFALADAAVVAWMAQVVTAAEIVAGGFAFVLVSWGAIVTVWKFDR
jgi:hypothetical protein